MTTATVTSAATTTHTNLGTTIPFDAIRDPGAYVCDWSGHLLRIPEDELTPRSMPRINIVGDCPLTVTKISENPFISVSRAKDAAADLNVTTSF